MMFFSLHKMNDIVHKPYLGEINTIINLLHIQNTSLNNNINLSVMITMDMGHRTVEIGQVRFDFNYRNEEGSLNCKLTNHISSSYPG